MLGKGSRMLRGAKGGKRGGARIENEKAAIYTSKLRLNAVSAVLPKRGGNGCRQENRCIFTGTRRCARARRYMEQLVREVFNKSRSTLYSPVHCTLEN